MFDDSSWKYSFVILMSAIIVVCGVYTFAKYLAQKRRQKAKEENHNENQ